MLLTLNNQVDHEIRSISLSVSYRQLNAIDQLETLPVQHVKFFFIRNGSLFIFVRLMLKTQRRLI
jgi:hypothetical protein